MTSRARLFIAPLGLLFAFGLGVFSSCSRPQAPSEQRLVPTEATSLQAPFVLRLQGPPQPPAAGATLSLEALLEVPSGITAPVPITVEVTTPAGVQLLNVAARQVISVGGATRMVRLPLSFQLTKSLGTPISVRASLERGEAMRAVAERFYPEPVPPAQIDSASSPPSPPLPGIPVGTPTETVR